ncbi:MAG: fliO, partial [Cryptosporangiaceae bacterium]|nr:fliO [Cryptosporangiaceae bacterium]
MDMLGFAARITLSLAAVLGLMWLLARMARKPLKARAAGAVAVLARQQLSRNASVAVVRIADRALVIGVTEAQVSLLAETDLAAITEALAQPEAISRTPVDLTDGSGDAAPAAAVTVTDLDSRRGGALAGSALSAATWKQAVDILRERTAR